MADAQHTGLGVRVVDPKLSAPRGSDASAGAFAQAQDDDADIQLDDGLPLHYYPGSGEEAPSTTAGGALDSSNKGFQLLQKMGWKGAGLGRNEDGIVEPVKGGVDAGVRLGLGKQEEDDAFTNAEGITRKPLESEVQASETEERRQRREMQAEREERIREDVSEMLRTFYCGICSKQYRNAREMEEHLSSYDHHHRKRMAETKAMMAAQKKDDRARREAKRLEKEAAQLNAQFMRAQAQQQGAAACAAPAAAAAAAAAQPPPPTASTSGAGGWGAPAPAAPRAGGMALGVAGVAAGAPAAAAPMQFGMSLKMGAGRGRGAGGTGRFGGAKRPAVMAPTGLGRPAKVATGAFGEDSDEEGGG